MTSAFFCMAEPEAVTEFSEPLFFHSKPGANGAPWIPTCAEVQSRSPYAFAARCGLGTRPSNTFVFTSDEPYCFVGVTCVPEARMK